LYNSTFSQTNSENEIMAEGSSRAKSETWYSEFENNNWKQKISVEKNAIVELNEEIEKLQKRHFFKIGFTENHIRISDYKISSTKMTTKKRLFCYKYIVN
jgi:hypothetical protein